MKSWRDNHAQSALRFEKKMLLIETIVRTGKNRTDSGLATQALSRVTHAFLAAWGTGPNDFAWYRMQIREMQEKRP